MSGQNKYLTFDEIKENYRNNIETPFFIFFDGWKDYSFRHPGILIYRKNGIIKWVSEYPEKFATFEKLLVRGIFDDKEFEGFVYNYRKRNLLLPHTNFTDKRAFFPIPTNDFFTTFKSMYKSNTNPNNDEQVEKAVSKTIKTLSEKTRSKTGRKFSLIIPHVRITTPREKNVIIIKNDEVERKIYTMGGKKYYNSKTKKQYNSKTKKQYNSKTKKQYKYSHYN
jgi:hypothetical protein